MKYNLILLFTTLFLFTHLGIAESIKTKPSKNSVALTFDDGPDPRFTPVILNILEEKGAKATFFVLGQQAQRYPELIKLILKGGHSIASHTYSHTNLKTLSAEKISLELRKTNETLEGIVGKKPKCLRPPYGALNTTVRMIAEQEGLKVVTWDLNSFDYTGKSPSELTSWVLNNARAGADILMHDAGRGGDRTSRALADIIDGYKAKNIGFDVLCN